MGTEWINLFPFCICAGAQDLTIISFEIFTKIDWNVNFHSGIASGGVSAAKTETACLKRRRI